MPGPDFAGLLKEAMGLDAASLGASAVERAVQKRQAACAIDDCQVYWLRLRASPGELQALIETIVVPETWFFRDSEAFAAMAQLCRKRVLEQPGRSLRLLSLPCSSGEEPFSMAIALLDAGLTPAQFHVDAIDISVHALGLAAVAQYGSNSFRSQDLGFRARHFSERGGRYQLADNVRACVGFQQGNLFAADFLPGQGRYEIVFCRNVLIYFDQPTQARAIDVLLRLLSTSGYLFVGPSETSLLPRMRLTPAQLPMAFAFHRAVEAAPAIESPAKRALPAAAMKSPPPKRAPTAVRPARQANSSKQAPGGTGAKPAAVLDLARIQESANAGRLSEAAELCERLHGEAGATAASYCLLAVIRDAQGDAGAAVNLYRKALYLEPAHADALVHLALLLDKQGERKAATVLRQRLRRLGEKAAT